MRRCTDPGAGGSIGTVERATQHLSRDGSLAQLARHDPDYLRRLMRTPTGRAYRVEIDALLAERWPDPGFTRPRERSGLFGRLATVAR